MGMFPLIVLNCLNGDLCGGLIGKMEFSRGDTAKGNMVQMVRFGQLKTGAIAPPPAIAGPSL